MTTLPILSQVNNESFASKSEPDNNFAFSLLLNSD